jgi:penicillin V acylase-like amidase (Ntn superfamily)
MRNRVFSALGVFSTFEMIVALSMVGRSAPACTTFAMKAGGACWVGKNYAWHQIHGALIVNPHGLRKKAFFPDSTNAARAASWFAKYGSVSFNQHGREMPVGGINEAGLVVETMWLDGTSYPKEGRSAVNELQFIQYQLDTAGTIAEVAQNLRNVIVAPFFAQLHYLICDKTGACLTVEFLGGQLVSASGEALKVKTLTNDLYATSLSYLSKFLGFGGSSPLSVGPGSLARFARASHAALGYGPEKGEAGAYAFSVLDNVNQPFGFSKWQIVYDQSLRQVRYRTRDRREVKTLNLADVSFSCRVPVKGIDLAAQVKGNIAAQLKPFTVENNREIIQKSVKGLKLPLPPAGIEAVSRYPETFVCEEN